MKELVQLFENYYNQHSEKTTLDNPSVRIAEKDLHLYLYENFSEDTYDEIIKPIYTLTRELEQQAYTIGFKTAIKIMLESVMTDN